jgi:predicted ABC-type transport system involved in lysophospholipase L1 biosynthesis ATPase subunit
MTDEKEALDALERVGLKDRSHHVPAQLSEVSSSGFVSHAP